MRNWLRALWKADPVLFVVDSGEPGHPDHAAGNAMRTCTCKRYGQRWRRYTTAKGYWGLGVTRGADKHWAVQAGKWVYTTSPAPMSRPYLTHACPHGRDRPHCLDCAYIDEIVEQLVNWTVKHIRKEYWEDFLTIPDIYRTPDGQSYKQLTAIDRIIADGDVEEIEAMTELVTNGDVKASRKK